MLAELSGQKKKGISERQKKMNELETNSTKDLYRGLNGFNKCYQHGTTIIKDNNGDQLAYSDGILKRWKNYFCQLFNAPVVNDVRQTNTHSWAIST
jgi:hypothetical protein